MADGRLGKCIQCAKADAAERTKRLKNNPDWVAKERARCREKQARRRVAGIVDKTPLKAIKKYRANNKEKIRARGLAIRRNPMSPGFCQRCGGFPKTLHRHHPDYSKPGEIVWLCPPCHGLQHRKNA
jgi:hypothetical protein